jgi:NADH:ubiquinone oxidoreductase subunit 3 (subunit A)
MPRDYYPVLLAFGVAILVGVSMMLLSYLLGRQVGGRIKLTTVESGVPLLDVSHKRISVAFFLVAIDFIVFDIEAAFLYPWALIIRSGGWPLFWWVMAFLFLIVVGFAYIWRKGGLDFAPRGNLVRRARP